MPTQKFTDLCGGAFSVPTFTEDEFNVAKRVILQKYFSNTDVREFLKELNVDDIVPEVLGTVKDKLETGGNSWGIRMTCINVTELNMGKHETLRFNPPLQFNPELESSDFAYTIQCVIRDLVLKFKDKFNLQLTTELLDDSFITDIYTEIVNTPPDRSYMNTMAYVDVIFEKKTTV